MSGDIHIGQVQAANAHIGGHHQVISGESGTFNNYVDPAAAKAELRSMLDELLRVIADNEVGPEVRHRAELARVEADAAAPRTTRLRELVDAIVAGAGKISVVAQAALNLLTVINKLPG
jgi:hypothetical protein